MRALGFAAWLLLVAGPAVAQSAPSSGLLHVIGRASVERVPDYASVQVGVATKGPTAAAALAENATASRRVIDLAKAAKIEDRDLATSAVTLSQAFKTVRDSGGGTSVPDGYTSQNSVTVRVRDVARLGELLGRLVEGGANRVDGVGFGLSDPGKALEDAQAEAVGDAIRRAGRIAEAAGVSLGPIERIEAPPRSDGQRSSQLFGAAMPAPPKVMRAVPVEAGTVEVTAEVDLTFRLLQR